MIARFPDQMKGVQEFTASKKSLKVAPLQPETRQHRVAARNRSEDSRMMVC